MLKALFAAFFVLLLGAVDASAQSNPGLFQGQVPTAAQWNGYFSAKQDVLNYTPLNQAGGTLTGRLNLAPSVPLFAGVNLGVGTAPTSPINGDLWTTTAGVFAQINGATVGPFATAFTPIAASVTFAQPGVTIGNVPTVQLELSQTIYSATYGDSGSGYTGACTSSTSTPNQVTLSTGHDFIPFEYLACFRAGPSPTTSALGGLAASAQGTPGATSVQYAATTDDGQGGMQAAIFATVSNSAATLSTTNFNAVTWTPVDPNLPTIIWKNVASGGWQYLGGVRPTWAVAISAAGTGGTNGTFPWTAAGGNCVGGVEPTGYVTISGGAITAATADPYWTNCSGTPIIPLPIEAGFSNGSLTLSRQGYFNDTGADDAANGRVSRPVYVPATPPAAPVNEWLIAQITAIGGTLNTTATISGPGVQNSETGQILYHDDFPAAQAAVNAASSGSPGTNTPSNVLIGCGDHLWFGQSLQVNAYYVGVQGTDSSWCTDIYSFGVQDDITVQESGGSQQIIGNQFLNLRMADYNKTAGWAIYANNFTRLTVANFVADHSAGGIMHDNGNDVREQNVLGASLGGYGYADFEYFNGCCVDRSNVYSNDNNQWPAIQGSQSRRGHVIDAFATVIGTNDADSNIEGDGWWIGASKPAVQFTASISGTNLTVSSVAGGTITAGMAIVDGTGNVTGLPTIQSQTSGTTGGAGVYVISASFTVSSETMRGAVKTLVSQFFQESYDSSEFSGSYAWFIRDGWRIYLTNNDAHAALNGAYDVYVGTNTVTVQWEGGFITDGTAGAVSLNGYFAHIIGVDTFWNCDPNDGGSPCPAIDVGATSHGAIIIGNVIGDYLHPTYQNYPVQIEVGAVDTFVGGNEVDYNVHPFVNNLAGGSTNIVNCNPGSSPSDCNGNPFAFLQVTGTTLPTQAAGTLGIGGIQAAPTLAANGEGDAFLTTANGLALMGKGSTYDIALLDSAGSVAFGVATGTLNTFAYGQLSVAPAAGTGTFIINPAASQPAQIGFQAASTTYWKVLNNASDLFQIQDTVNANTLAFQITTGGNMTIGEIATATLTLRGILLADAGISGLTTVAATTSVSVPVVISTGTVPTGTTGSCVASSFSGGSTAGKFSAAVCAAGTIILSALPAAPTGYTCHAYDQTTPADTLVQTANSTTSATFKATTVASDVVAFACFGW